MKIILVSYSPRTKLVLNEMFMSVRCVQESPQCFLKDEELPSSISPPATPGRDTDGGGHQEV